MNHVHAVLLCFVPCVDVFMPLFSKFFDIDGYICLCFVLMMYMYVRSELCELAQCLNLLDLIYLFMLSAWIR